MIVLAAALESELKALRKRWRLQRDRTAEAGGLWRGRIHGVDVVLVRTGMGKERAAAAVRTALEHCRTASLLVSFGFAGALRSDLRPGDPVLCTHVRPADEDDRAEIALWSGDRDRQALSRWVQELSRRGVDVRRGRLVTAAGVVRGSEAKRRLGERYGAAIVDMESYAIAGVAAEHGLPLLGVRVVSDALEDRIPALPLDQLVRPDGRLCGCCAVRHALRSLRDLPASLRLYRNVRRAESRLTEIVERLAEALATEEAS